MSVWLLALTLIGIILAAWWYYTRRLDWQIAHITAQLNKITDKRQIKAAAGKRILSRIYKIINASLHAGKANDAYRGFDLLKLALGQGLGRPGEPVRLTAAVYLAVKSNQLDIAGHGIDAFRPLLKNMKPDEVPAAVEQLALIAVLSLKKRQNFLAARTVEVIAVGMGTAEDDTGHASVMRALRLIGLFALRRQDTGLILELQSKIETWLTIAPSTVSTQEQVAGILSAWLHRIVKTGDASQLEILTQYIDQLVKKELLAEPAITNIIAECNYLAGMDSRNPYSRLTGAISMTNLELAVQMRTVSIWRQSVDGAGQAARLAIAQRTLTECFAVGYPLFEMGRRLLIAELNAGPLQDSFRQQALYVLVRECLQLIEFVGRQNFTVTAADIIDQIYLDWLERQGNVGHNKSIKKFCQLLFLYCTRIKRRQKRTTADGADFNTGEGITAADREQLKELGFISE